MKGFLRYLAATPAEYGDPLSEEHARDYAARDHKTYLKTVGKAKPSSVNLTLAAIDSFYRFMGMGKPDAKREDLPGVAPGALSPEEQKKFLRAVERSSSARDRAMARVLFFAGLRASELVGLDAEDVAVSARKGRVIVRSGRGDAYREVALNAEARGALVWAGVASLFITLAARLAVRLVVRLLVMGALALAAVLWFAGSG